MAYSAYGNTPTPAATTPATSAYSSMGYNPATAGAAAPGTPGTPATPATSAYSSMGYNPAATTPATAAAPVGVSPVTAGVSPITPSAYTPGVAAGVSPVTPAAAATSAYSSVGYNPATAATPGVSAVSAGVSPVTPATSAYSSMGYNPATAATPGVSAVSPVTPPTYTPGVSAVTPAAVGVSPITPSAYTPGVAAGVSPVTAGVSAVAPRPLTPVSAGVSPVTPATSAYSSMGYNPAATTPATAAAPVGVSPVTAGVSPITPSTYTPGVAAGVSPVTAGVSAVAPRPLTPVSAGVSAITPGVSPVIAGGVSPVSSIAAGVNPVTSAAAARPVAPVTAGVSPVVPTGATPTAPKPAPVLSAEVQGMINAHKQAKKMGKKQGTGGMFPLCLDPQTNEVFILLGLNREKQYCHFHGWVDEGETYEQGLARESWEESRGLIGRMTDLWRATMLGGVYTMPFVGSSQIILLGAMGAIDRSNWATAFLSLPVYYDAMDEIVGVDWVSARSLRNVCLAYAQDRIDGFAAFEANKNHATLVGTSPKYAVTGFKPGCTLRPFLHGWFCSRDGMAWMLDPRYSELLDRGNVGNLKSMPTLTPLTKDEHEAICAVLSIPIDAKTGAEGHITGQDDVLADKKSRRRGTLAFKLKEWTNEQGQKQQGVQPFIQDDNTTTTFSLGKDDTSRWTEILHTVVEQPPKNGAAVAQAWNELKWNVTFRPRMKGLTHYVAKDVIVLPLPE